MKAKKQNNKGTNVLTYERKKIELPKTLEEQRTKISTHVAAHSKFISNN